MQQDTGGARSEASAAVAWPRWRALSYKFHHKNSGRQIQDSQTLAAAGVHDGDILRLQPEITAG